MTDDLCLMTDFRQRVSFIFCINHLASFHSSQPQQKHKPEEVHGPILALSLDRRLTYTLL